MHACMYMLLYSGQAAIDCQWKYFVDKESQVEYYKFGVGRGEGDDSVFSFQRIGQNINKFTATGTHCIIQPFTDSARACALNVN